MSKRASTFLETIVARQRVENDRYDRELDQYVQKAKRFVQSIPAMLLAVDPALRKIVLFGSLGVGAVKRLEFDIDLAVDSDRYLQIVGWSLQQPWPIDVIDLTGIDEVFAREIEDHGKVLYEAKR